MSSTAPPVVSRRRVFYIPGYDPFPPRRYRELYRKECQTQAAISGYDIALETGEAGDYFGWRVGSRIDGHVTLSDIEVLVWSDIVRASRAPGVALTYLALLRTAWIYLRCGALFRLMRLRKGPVIAALYPVGVLLLQAVFAAALCWAFVQVMMRMGKALGLTEMVVFSGAIVMATLLFGLVLRWFKDMDGKIFAYYLMHDFAFSAKDNGAYPDALEQRLMQFRARVSAAMQGDVDEVLVVGHSSGAHLAISMLADLLRDEDVAGDGPKLSLLSLGHVVPMISFLPKAQRLRADLARLRSARSLTWVDVTAPGDGCCFALCDPVAVSGQDGTPRFGPLVFSAAFTQSLSRERWRALRWRFFRLHFQYLCAFDQPKDYDYFQITAGPVALADRYRGRASSKSIRTHPQSRFKTVTL
ncbi:MAG: hypothetical protein AAF665_13470 [Pseudomonadota bacterium]